MPSHLAELAIDPAARFSVMPSDPAAYVTDVSSRLPLVAFIDFMVLALVCVMICAYVWNRRRRACMSKEELRREDAEDQIEANIW